MRKCDNCGTVSGDAFCPSCGKPFPPPVFDEPNQDQVEFAPPAQPQRTVPVEPAPVPETRTSFTQRSDGSYSYRTETYRYRGPSEIRLARPRDATGAYALGVFSIVMGFIFGPLGLILGLMAVYMGKKAQREGLVKAEAAIAVGYVGIVISVLMMILLFGTIFAISLI